MEKIYKDVEFMGYPKEKRIYNSSIDAIPIEWIKKWNIDNYPYTTLLMTEIIPKMIEDWEKENEVQI